MTENETVLFVDFRYYEAALKNQADAGLFALLSCLKTL